MKKVILISVLSVLMTNFSTAQFYSSINGIASIPVSNDVDVDVNFGGGINLTIGYLVKNNFDCSITTENLWFSSMLDNFKINSTKTNFKYIILEKTVKPYIGLGVGYYRKSFDLPFASETKETGIGINPSIGTLINTKIVDGLNINAELSYVKVYTEHSISLINFNIGLLYYFGVK